MICDRKFRQSTSVVTLAFAASLVVTSSAYSHFIGVTGNNSIDGSLCVGFDCAAEEAFGFDTIRLKENNLRIDFVDTSNTAAFPPNDWRIVINDSANGGANHFSIEDRSAGNNVFRIFAGARNNALVVDSQGDVGIGTTTPALDIDIKTGNTPSVRLQQDGSSGFTPQTWDVAGNESNFFIRDATNGSQLPFRIRPGADSDSIFIDADNDVGFGTASPLGKLHTSGPGTQLVYFESSDEGAVQIRMVSDSTNRRFLARNGANTATMSQIVFGDNEVRIAGATDTGANLYATINASGILTQGPTCSGAPCDGVFDPSIYKVESIEDHAEYMWENKHLWGVGPTSSAQMFNVTEKTAGILHELEKAHVYIEQLNDEKKVMRSEVNQLGDAKKAIQLKVAKLESRLAEVSELNSRLETQLDESKKQATSEVASLHSRLLRLEELLTR